MKVAFIGLGRMGTGMARRLVQVGFDITVYNRTASKMAPLVELGAHAADLVEAAVRDADVIVTSLIDDRSVLSLTEDHLLAAMRTGAIHVGTTTISPGCADRLGELHLRAGSKYLAAPIAGRPDAAETGKLVCYVAGDQEAANMARPVCLAYATSVTYVSDQYGRANALKLCLNFFASSFIEIVGEAYTLAEKAGVDTAYVRDFLASAVAHPALKTYADNIHKREFDSSGGFAMEGGLKDLRLMRETAADVGAPLEIAAITERKMLTGVNNGMRQLDWSAIYEVTRQQAGLE